MGALCVAWRSVERTLEERFLHAHVEVPHIARADVSPLEVSLEHRDQVGPVVDLVGQEFIEPPTRSVREEKWKLLDDGSIVPSSASQLACQPEICQP